MFLFLQFNLWSGAKRILAIHLNISLHKTMHAGSGTTLLHMSQHLFLEYEFGINASFAKCGGANPWMVVLLQV